MANIGVSGRVIDESKVGVAGLTVLVYDHDVLFPDEPLGRAETDANGDFKVSYPAGSYGLEAAPDLQLRVFDRTNRRVHQSDVEQNVVAPILAWKKAIKVNRADVDGWFATGTTDPTIGPTDGNTVEPLIDNEVAWDELTRSIQLATRSIWLMPFGYTVPDFESDPDEITPVVVIRFERPPENVRTTDTRLEDLLLQANRRAPSVEVLALMHKNLLVHDADAVDRYFKAAQPNTVRVRTFHTKVTQMTHAKIVVIDSRVAFLLGSPLSQDYFDGSGHRVDDARRGLGGPQKLPVHDVSLRITGPAVRDIEKFFALHWKAQGGGDVGIDAPPPPLPGDLTVHMVRTLPEGQFASAADGEKTVIESYLRAIGHAERFIYLENQYFVNATISEALVARLQARPNLQLILAMNCKADIPWYSEYRLPIPLWAYLLWFPLIPFALDYLFHARQSRRIQEILRHLGPAKFASQVGVFTLWTHEATDPANPNGARRFARSKPRLMPNYIHAKVGIIDDAWMTVGSANLDRFSMEGNSESNAVVANRQVWQPVPAIASFRRRLWSEHLGYTGPEHPDLAGDKNWLDLWRNSATSKLQDLMHQPLTPNSARVLGFPYKGDNVPLRVQDPEVYLLELGLTKEQLGKLYLQEETTPFDFRSHTWK